MGYSQWDPKELDMTECMHMRAHTHTHARAHTEASWVDSSIQTHTAPPSQTYILMPYTASRHPVQSPNLSGQGPLAGSPS